MSTENERDQIIHAWLLVYAPGGDQKIVAEQIFERVNTLYQDSKNTFVNGVDVTDGPFNLMMQVSAQNNDDLHAIVSLLTEFDGVEQLLVARVLEHVPEAGPPGLTRGENAWG